MNPSQDPSYAGREPYGPADSDVSRFVPTGTVPRRSGLPNPEVFYNQALDKPPRPTVNSELAELEKTVFSLQDSLHQLGARLESVLEPAFPVGEKESKPETASTPLLQQIRDLTLVVRTLRTSCITLTDRVRL